MNGPICLEFDRERNMKQENLIIIGAPRSGTNILRDVLSSFRGIGTWPCDEINYIWRHCNPRYPSDEFPPEFATARVATYMRKKFDDIRKSQGVNVVLEKTCANCLRVHFVDRAVPNAKYIYIYRDGIDAAISATLRWTAELDIAYIMKKARFVPISDLPYYSSKYLYNRIRKSLSKENRLSFWGPAFRDIHQIVQKYTVEEVCAIQWRHCVEKAETAFADIPEERLIRVRYEDFVQNPINDIVRILSFVNIEAPESQISDSVTRISSKSIGKGRKKLSRRDMAKLEELIGGTMDRYGYRSKSYY